MQGNMVPFTGNGSTYEGYLSVSTSGTGPAVVLIQEWWGLVGHIKHVADRLAAEGFNVLAPDFYHGKATSEPDEAAHLMMALNIVDAERVIAGAVDHLLAMDSTLGEKVGVVGFCMGGQLSMFAACVNPHVGACVNFYGIHPNVVIDIPKLSAPILGLFAEYDGYAGPTEVESLSAKLKMFGKAHEFVIYPDANHAFFNSDRPEVYHREAAEDSWNRTLAFLRLHLSGEEAG